MEGYGPVVIGMMNREAVFLNFGLDAQFLGEFSSETFFKRFPRLLLTPRKLPHAALMASFPPSGNQDLSGPKEQSGGHLKVRALTGAIHLPLLSAATAGRHSGLLHYRGRDQPLFYRLARHLSGHHIFPAILPHPSAGPHLEDAS